jgi:hypothetical protein
MEISAVSTIARQIRAILAKDDIVGTARIVDNHVDSKYNDGHWIELKAVKAVHGNSYQFALMILVSNMRRLGPTAVLESFCAQSVHALGNVTVSKSDSR